MHYPSNPNPNSDLCPNANPTRNPTLPIKGNSKSTPSSSVVGDVTAGKEAANSSSPRATNGARTAARKPIEKGIHIAVSRPSAVLKSAQTLDLSISNTLEIMPDPNLDDHDHHSSSEVLPPTSPFPGKENYQPLLNEDSNNIGGLDETKGISSPVANKESMDQVANLEAAPVRVVRALRENGDHHGKV